MLAQSVLDTMRSDFGKPWRNSPKNAEAVAKFLTGEGHLPPVFAHAERLIVGLARKLGEPCAWYGASYPEYDGSSANAKSI